MIGLITQPRRSLRYGIAGNLANPLNQLVGCSTDHHPQSSIIWHQVVGFVHYLGGDQNWRLRWRSGKWLPEGLPVNYHSKPWLLRHFRKPNYLRLTYNNERLRENVAQLEVLCDFLELANGVIRTTSTFTNRIF